MFEGEDLRGDIGGCVAESLSTMVPAMASSTAIFVDSISHRRPPGQPVSANSRSRLDEHPVALCGVMVIVAVQCCQRRPETYSAALGHLALGGHLRDPSSSSRSGHTFHGVAAFDFIILASRRLGRGALLACHLISHRCFRYKCTALFSSASLVCNKFALSDGGWSFFSATPANKRVLCYTPRPKLGSGPNERLSRRR
jgi:hypothetical protein